MTAMIRCDSREHHLLAQTGTSAQNAFTTPTAEAKKTEYDGEELAKCK